METKQLIEQLEHSIKYHLAPYNLGDEGKTIELIKEAIALLCQLEPPVIPQKQGIISEGINMKNYPIHKPLNFENTIKPLWIVILVISIIFFGISLAMFLSV